MGPSYGRNQSDSVEWAVCAMTGARMMAESRESGFAKLIYFEQQKPGYARGGEGNKGGCSKDMKGMGEQTLARIE